MNSLSGIAIRPVERPGVPVIKSDVSHDLLAKVGRGLEHAATDAIASDQTQPDLDLVQPGGIGRGEVESHIRVLPQPGFHGGRFVSREVIQDHMNLPRMHQFREPLSKTRH